MNLAEYPVRCIAALGIGVAGKAISLTDALALPSLHRLRLRPNLHTSRGIDRAIRQRGALHIVRVHLRPQVVRVPIWIFGSLRASSHARHPVCEDFRTQ